MEKNKIVKAFTALCLATVASIAMMSCGKSNNPSDNGDTTPTATVDTMETNASYYCEDKGGSEFTNVGNKFTLSVSGKLYSGTIVKNGNNLSFEFDNNETLNASAVLNGDKIVFTIDNVEYTFLKKLNYTVKFDTDGGAEVADAKVLNGQAVTKPAAPTKDGYVFVGWYTSANYTEKYDFTKGVTSNETVYARFVQKTSTGAEYSVSLVNGDKTDKANTLGGALFDLPTPAGEGNFAGWWVSATGNVDQLTYKYEEGTVLTGDTVLVAVWDNGNPIVSVTNKGVSWTGIGTNVVYNVQVKNDKGVVVKENSTQSTSYAYNFDDMAEGVYTVVVTGNSKSGTATYVNKQLANVVTYSIENGVLYFEGVQNATNYSLEVACGNHTHNVIDLGSTYSYDFTTCTMKDGGIVFTLTATAEGYLDSVTVITYNKELSSVTGLSYDPSTDVVSWNPVFGAKTYVVTVSSSVTEGEETTTISDTYYLDNQSLDLREYTGDVTVSVYPQTPGYNSPEATEVSYSKDLLSTPQGLRITGKDEDEEGYVEGAVGYVVWKEVAGATGYVVDINGTKYPVSTNELVITTDMEQAGVTEYDIKVQAVYEAENSPTKTSFYTDAIAAFTYWTGNVWYENGTVYWDYYLGVQYYAVRINSNSLIWKVSGGNSSSSRHWTSGAECYQDGFNLIEVTYYEGTTVKSADYSGIDVYMNRIYYMTETVGTPNRSELYAEDDYVPLYTPTKPGYTLDGWYSTADGKESGASKYESLKMPGRNTVIYAVWTPNTYTIELINDEDFGTCDSESAEVVFGTTYALPVAETKIGTCTFAGWYSLPNGQGTRYTDEKGVCLNEYIYSDNVKAYAYYPSILTYKTTVNKANETAYEVSAGGGIGFVSEITIPATYTDPSIGTAYPVCNIGSFKNCTTLTTINIPDTVEIVDYTLGFTGCTLLKEINVYTTDEENEGNYETFYTSEDGVLYFNNNSNAVAPGWQLVYVPYAHTNDVHVMEGTVSMIYIGQAWRAANVYIPYTVKEIQASAFKSSYSIKTITFEPTPEKDAEGNDVTPVGLSIGKDAFISCTGLTSITLPKRLAVIDTTLFTSCSALKEINIEEGGTKYASVQGVIANATKNELIYAPKGIEGVYSIPQGVTKVQASAFMGCTKLTGVIVGNWVQYIGIDAFSGCTKIESIEFLGTEDDATLTIDEKAFYGLTPLTSVTLSENVRVVKANAFGGTTKLTEITVLASGDIKYATNITAYTSTTSTASSYIETVNIGPLVPEFDIVGCFGGTNDKLSVINIDPENKSYKTVDDVLYNSDITTVIFFPKSYASEYVLPETITKIAAGAFQKRTNITSIVINKNVTEIGDYAFYYCKGLTSVTFEDGGTKGLKIGGSAFYYCSTLQELALPKRTTEIGDYAFGYMSLLTSFVVPEGVTSIGERAFYYDSNLKEVTLPASAEKLGSFDGDKVTMINLFDNCSSLATLNVASGNKVFTTFDNILYGTSESGKPEKLIFCPPGKAGNIVVPSSVNEISDYAFYKNKAITSFGFENNKSAISIVDGKEVQGVLKVGAHAFDNCRNMVSCSLPNIEYIPEYMLYYCDSLESFTVPNTVKAIGYMYYDAQQEEDVLVSARYAFSYSTKSVIFEAGNEETPLVFPNAVTITEKVSGGKTTVTYADSSSGSPFYYSNIEDITFPERTTGIGSYAFYRSSSNTTLKNITFPKTVKSIGDYAFYYNQGLTEISFPEDSQLTAIGRYAFYYCKGLTSVQLPKELSSIGQKLTDKNTTTTVGYTFYYCSQLQSIEIPAGVLSIPYEDFYRCEALKTVTFAEGSALETIGKYAFEYAGLETISIPASVKLIDTYAFAYCKSLKSITFAEKTDLAAIGNYAFSATGLETFTFPTYYVKNASDELVTEVGKYGTYLFNNCAELKEVNFSASIGSIPTGTFNGCSSLENITVSADNETLAVDDQKVYIMSKDGKTIFYSFSAPEDGRLEIPATVTTINPYAFDGNEGITYLYIPNTVTKIGEYAFRNCSNLLEVEFQDGNGTGNNAGVTTMVGAFTASTKVGNMGYHVFDSCTALTRAKLPATMKQIPQYTFYKCTALNDVVFPTYAPKTYSSTNTGVQIGGYAFAYCGFVTLNIPENVTEIGGYAFGYNTNLKSVVINSKPSAGSFATTGATAGDPSSLSNTVTLAKGYNPYIFRDCTQLESVEFKGNAANTTYLGTYMFYNDSKLTTVKLPTALQTLPSGVFQNCTSLEGVEITDKIRWIGNYTFDGCTSITEFTFPEKLEKVGNYSFRNTKIAEFNLPSTCVTIGTYAFAGTKVTEATYKNGISYGTGVYQNCKELEKVTIEDGITLIPSYTFDGCSKIKEVIIPKSVQYLGTSSTSSVSSYVFRNCTALETVTFEEGINLLGIGNYTFYGCSSLKNIALPNNVQILGQYAFQKSGLTEITIPASVVYAGYYTFADCADLQKVTFEDSEEHALDHIIEYMFNNCVSLTEVNVPDYFTVIAAYAFNGCSSLASFNFPESLDFVGNYAFSKTGFETVTIPGTITNLGGTYKTTCSITVDSKTKETTISMTPTLSASETDSHLFDECHNLTAVTVEEGVSSLPAYMFQKDDALVTVTLPESLLNMESSVFKDCTALTTIKAPNVMTYGSYVFSGCTSLENYALGENTISLGTYCFEKSAITEITVPAKVSSLPTKAFYMCEALQTATILGTDFGSIADSVFEGCTALTTVVLPESTASIGKKVFMNCNQLNSVNFPSGLTKIGDFAFQYTAITMVDLPAKLDTIGYNPFANCKALNTITVSSDNGAFYADSNIIFTAEGAIVVVPASTEGEYVVPQDSVICAAAFAGCEKITKVTLPDNITVIPTYAFAYMPNLEELVVKGKIVEVEGYAFAESTKLTTFDMSNLTKLNSYAFAYSGIKNAVIPETLTSLPTYTFSNSALETISFEGEVSIGSYCFEYCEGMTEFTMTKNIKSFGSYPFQYTGLTRANILPDITYTNGLFARCESLDEVVIAEGVETIPSYCFAYSGPLTKITWPSTITSLGTYSFEYTMIDTVELPETLTAFPIGLFDGSEIKSIVIPETILSIPNYCFRNCTQLTSVDIKAPSLDPASYCGTSAFANCTALKSIYLPVFGTDIKGSSTMFQNWTAGQTIYLSFSVDNMYSSTYVNYLTLETNIGQATVVFDFDPNKVEIKTVKDTVTDVDGNLYLVERTLEGATVRNVQYYAIDLAAGTVVSVEVTVLKSANATTYLEIVNDQVKYAVINGTKVDVTKLSYDAETATYTYDGTVDYTLTVVEGVLVVAQVVVEE